jgi:hypothetical protein
MPAIRRDMSELQLTRVPGDRRAFELERAGVLRLKGRMSRGATAESGGRNWDLARHGFVRPSARASDAAGTVVGEYTTARAFRRGGALRWGGREYALRPASRWRERYALAVGDRELATFDGKGWGKRPVTVTVADGAQLEPGLLLFTAFVVRGLAEDAAASAAT